MQKHTAVLDMHFFALKIVRTCWDISVYLRFAPTYMLRYVIVKNLKCQKPFRIIAALSPICLHLIVIVIAEVIESQTIFTGVDFFK